MEISEISYPINRNTTNAYSYYSSFAYPPFLPTQSKPISLQLYRPRCNHRTKTKPRKKNLHSSRSLRIVSWKTNASREAFESLSVDASRLTTSFANEPIWKFPCSKWSATLERAHARFVPDAPSIGSSLYHRSANISGKAKEPTSRPPFISTKLFDRER